MAARKCYSSNDSDVLSSIITGIISGLLASIVVAWILDLESCTRKNAMLKKAVDDDIAYLKLWIDMLFQEMRDNLRSHDYQKGLKFETLFPLYVEQCRENNNTEVLGDNTIAIYVNINMIISTIDKLTTGEEKEYLLTEFGDVSSFLILAKAISDYRDNLFNNGNFNYNFIYSGIFDFLSTVILFVDLLSKEYKVTKMHQKILK